MGKRTACVEWSFHGLLSSRKVLFVDGRGGPRQGAACARGTTGKVQWKQRAFRPICRAFRRRVVMRKRDRGSARSDTPYEVTANADCTGTIPETTAGLSTRPACYPPWVLMPLTGKKQSCRERHADKLWRKMGAAPLSQQTQDENVPRLDGYQEPPLSPLRGRLRMRRLNYRVRIVLSKGLGYAWISLYGLSASVPELLGSVIRSRNVAQCLAAAVS